MRLRVVCVFFFNDTATTEIYTLSLHDALPISAAAAATSAARAASGSCPAAFIQRRCGGASPAEIRKAHASTPAKPRFRMYISHLKKKQVGRHYNATDLGAILDSDPANARSSM